MVTMRIVKISGRVHPSDPVRRRSSPSAGEIFRRATAARPSSLAADAGELFDRSRTRERCPRSGMGQSMAISLFQIGFEIEIAPAVTFWRPHMMDFPPNLAATNPGKMFSGREGVGIFPLSLTKKLVRILIGMRNNTRAEWVASAHVRRDCPSRRCLSSQTGNMLDVIALGDDAAARLRETSVLRPFFGEFLGGPKPPVIPETNNDCIVSSGRHVRPY